MISIRFLGARSRAPAPLVDASVRGGASIAMESAGTPEPLCVTLLDRLEPDDVAVGYLADAPLVGQQVDVAEHLRERQEGLGHGDVAPQLLGDLVRRARALGDQPEDLLGAAAVKREALVDQRPMVGDRARRARGARSRPAARGCGAATRCRSSAPAGARSSRRAGGRSAGWRRCGRSGGRRRAGSAAPRPRTACPMGCAPAGAAPRARDREAQASSPSCSGRVTSARAPQARKLRDTRAQRRHDVLGDPVAEHQRGRELVVALDVLAEVLDERDHHVDRRDLGPRARGDDLDQPEVVDVLVGQDDQLDVLERVPERRRAGAAARPATCRSSGPVSTSVSGSSSIR